MIDLTRSFSEILVSMPKALGRCLLRLISACVVNFWTTILTSESLLVLKRLSENVWHLIHCVRRLLKVPHH